MISSGFFYSINFYFSTILILLIKKESDKEPLAPTPPIIYSLYILHFFLL